MHKDRSWFRRAQIGPAGYAVLFSAPPMRPQPRMRVVAQPAAVPRGAAVAAHRRRQVLTVMLTALAGPALVGLATGSATAWWVVVGLLPFVCAYLAVLFRARRLMAEREINVAFSGSPQRGRPGLEDVFRVSYNPDEEVAAASGGY